MKRFLRAGLRRAGVLAMSLSCILCMSGCSGHGARRLLEQAEEKLHGVSSSVNYVEVAIQLEDVLELREVNLEMTMENTTEPPAGHASGSAKVNIRDARVEAELEIYQVMEDGDYVTYSSIDGEWNKEVAENEAENHLGLDSSIFAREGKAMESFHLSEETVTVEGRECYQMYGEMTGEELMGLLGRDMINAFGLVDLPSGEAVREMNIPVIFDMYKEEMLPARIHVNMSDVLNELYDSYGETTKVNLYSIELVFTDYDKVDRIEVPDEVRDAAEQIVGSVLPHLPCARPFSLPPRLSGSC